MRILKGLSVLLLYENCYGKDFQNTPTALKVSSSRVTALAGEGNKNLPLAHSTLAQTLPL